MKIILPIVILTVLPVTCLAEVGHISATVCAPADPSNPASAYACSEDQFDSNGNYTGTTTAYYYVIMDTGG